jgi:hypothetical protein
MSTKGSRKRPTQISRAEEELRYELAFRCKDNPKRKAEILKLLAEIHQVKENDNE